MQPNRLDHYMSQSRSYFFSVRIYFLSLLTKRNFHMPIIIGLNSFASHDFRSCHLESIIYYNIGSQSTNTNLRCRLTLHCNKCHSMQCSRYSKAFTKPGDDSIFLESTNIIQSEHVKYILRAI